MINIASIHRWDWVRGRLDPPPGSGLYPAGEPGARPYNRSAYCHKLNRHVVGLTLDLRHARGKALYKRLVARVDVVVENFSPRVMPQLGLDSPALCQGKPDIIMMSMPAFGSTGPEASSLGYGAA